MLSWLIASSRRGLTEYSPSKAVTFGVVAIAAVKSRLIIREFMEVRSAPRWLGRLTDAWLLALVSGIVVLYLA